MTLTASAVKAAKARKKQYRLYDERGLYLQVNPSGGRYWRFKYRFEGKEKVLALGTFPEITLADARDRREDARRLVAKGIDPSKQRRARRQAREGVLANSFEVIAREWLASRAGGWSESTKGQVTGRLTRDVFPWIGDRPIEEIEAPELLDTLRRVENRGAVETAHRIRSSCSQVFKYAIATGRARRNPAADLDQALKTPDRTHYASITDPRKIGPLLRDIDGYWGTEVVRFALRIAPYVFLRPGNLRKSEWEFVNFHDREWRIPLPHMKRPAPHIIPLSDQVLGMLKGLHTLTGKRSKFLFPNMRSAGRPMSENTINAAFRNMGYETDVITAHGLRHMASTMLHENGWDSDAVERQLAHMDRNETRATYNYAQYLQQRRLMMQSWADYLDELRDRAAEGRGGKPYGWDEA